MPVIRRALVVLAVIAFAAGLAGCGDTWEGFKKDTSENLKKTGDALERAGDNLSK